MKFFTKFLFLVFIAAQALANVPEELYLKTTPPVQLPMAARYMVYLENKQNPAGTKSEKPFWIEHIEIPLSYIQEDAGKGLNQQIHESLLFTNSEGVKMVRWILNPEDTVWGNEVIENLKAKGLHVERKRFFIGYTTSSRSCLVQNPETGVVFSIKTSTNVTAGNWKDKKETVRAAKAGRMMSDYIAENYQAKDNRTLSIVKEPLAYYIPEVDQGIIVRQYDHFFKNVEGRKLVPVFSFVERLEYYAQKSEYQGSLQEFFNETLVKRGGQVTAELFLNYGIVYNSPHGQNFLIELDRNEKPTGRIYARDYADSHLFEPIMKARPLGADVLEHYKTFVNGSNTIMTESASLFFGPYYNGSMKIPSWVTHPLDMIKTFNESVKTRILQTLQGFNSSHAFLNYERYGDATRYWGQTIEIKGELPLAKWVRSLSQVQINSPLRTPISVVPPAEQPLPKKTQPTRRAPVCRSLFAS